jgi:D-arabinose 1-dehydrogenase-like Zn-dependent alcohol dehydrogenase
MAKMRAIQVSKANGPFELVEREIPEPGTGAVRIKVQACGICHSDSILKEGILPGLQYPRVPGHEVVGIVDAIGGGVEIFKVGQRVGVGWNGGYCGHCDQCRRGQFFACTVYTDITGITRDGGYADYMIAPWSAVALVPDGLSPEEGGPLMCAGVTTFNALRRSGARPGDLVAVHGLGGLGHLGVQYASRMGFNTVAIARGQDKEALARQLGAHRYIDSQATDAANELAKMGGAKVVLATVTNRDAMSSLIGGLGVEGKLLVVGAPDSLTVTPYALIAGKRSINGWYSGTSIDSQDALAFSVRAGVRSMNEEFPLEKVSEAYDRMSSGKVRFRAVLTTGN